MFEYPNYSNTPLLQLKTGSNQMAKRKLTRPRTGKPSQLHDERWIHFYRQMLKIRLFEEEVNQLYLGAKMPGLAHLYIGEEAVAVGVCEALRRDDYITSTHRGHGHCIAKGAALDRMFAELLGKEAGYCRGKGGSMHIADQDTGNLGANAIVGGSAGMATGAALSAKMRGSDQVAVCFFGDGALGQGLLYESMNMASLWKLPVIYVCENNQYNEYTHYSETTAGELLARAQAFGIHGDSLDGQDVRAVHAAALRGIERARRGGGPAFHALQHLPLSRPPRRRHRSRLLSIQEGRRRMEEPARSAEAAGGLAEEKPVGRLPSCSRRSKAKSGKEIKEAVNFALNAPYPPTDEVDQHVYA